MRRDGALKDAAARECRLGLCRRLQSQFLHRNLQVRPRFLLLPRIAQQKCRMIGNNQAHPAISVHSPAQPGQRLPRAQQISRRCRSQRHQNLRPHNIDLAKQETASKYWPRPAPACGCPAACTSQRWRCSTLRASAPSPRSCCSAVARRAPQRALPARPHRRPALRPQTSGARPDCQRQIRSCCALCAARIACNRQGLRE